MAGSTKSYIVNYDIRANVGNATGALETMAKAAQELVGPMERAATAVKDINTAIKSLEANKNFVFRPTIDLADFNSKIEQMVMKVEVAATKMHQAIYGALTGNPTGTKVTQDSIKAALNTRASALQKAIDEEQKKIDKIYGDKVKDAKNRTRYQGGLLNGTTDKAQKKALREEARMYKNNIADLNKQLDEVLKQQTAEEEKLNKTAEKANKAANKIGRGATTNVTPATIRAWKKAFDNDKLRSLTIRIRGNANGPDGAISVINTVKTQLQSLGSLGQFTITPLINAQAFALAESQLKSLAALTSKITAPFITQEGKKDVLKPGKSGRLTKAEKTSLNEAKQRAEELRKQIAPVQQRLDKNQQLARTSITSGLKGQITRDTNRLNALKGQLATHEETINKLEGKQNAGALVGGKKLQPYGVNVKASLNDMKFTGKTPTVPVNIKIASSSVASAINALKKPTLPVNVKLMWEKGAIGKQNQLKGLTEKIPPIKLVLDDSQALAKLEGFLAKIKAASPQTIALTATGAAGATAAATTATGGSTQPTTGATGTRGNQPSKSSAPSGYMGSGKNRVFFGNQRPDNSLAPKGFQWQRDNTLATRLTGSQANSYAEALSKQQAAFKNLTNVNSSTQAALDQAKTMMPNSGRYSRLMGVRNELQSRIGSLTQQRNQVYRQWLKNQGPFNTLNQQLKQVNQQIQTLTSLPKLNAAQKRMLGNLQNARGVLTGQINALTAPRDQATQLSRQIGIYNNRLTGVENAIQQETSTARTNAAAPLRQQRAEARKAYSEARKAAQAYTKGWKLAPTPSQAPTAPVAPVAQGPSTTQRYAKIANNAVAPYVTNASQLKLASENLPFFRQAMKNMGLTPDAALWQNESYLKEVQRLMIKRGAAVPSYLPTAISQAQRAAARGSGGGGGGGVMVMPKGTAQLPYDARVRRWTYPFTGPSSFGVRTPMAVEMAKGMGVMFAIGGAMSALSNAGSQAMEYQNVMKTTNAILRNGNGKYSEEAFKNMEHLVRDVGIKTKFSAPEVASATRFLAMAGLSIDQINQSIRPIADLALIGDYDLGETADKITNIMTTFGLDKKMADNPRVMRETANIMAAVATRSNTDVMMLAESAKYGGGVAAMYNRNDPNIFADTMALFGVMGNAGIQGSSAGTALRMMYQNIFNPNKNQRAILEKLESQGLRRYNADGTKRSMADILMWIANNIDEKVQPDIISKLFRITAQPGANAAINAAVNQNAMSLFGIAQEEGANPEEVFEAYSALTKSLTDKGGLGSLASLMLAARNSAGGNISGEIAEEKQNTLAGLWAQVTSTFTEGIVKAFEQREGGFAGMLMALRDYFAKPETVEMLKNLIDLVVDLGKVMAEFVKIWAQLYSFAPGVLKFWIITQMVFKQIGALLLPYRALVDAGSKLTGMFGVAGAGAVGASAVRTAGAAGAGAAGARLASVFKRKTPQLGVGDALLTGAMFMPYSYKTPTLSPAQQMAQRQGLAKKLTPSWIQKTGRLMSKGGGLYLQGLAAMSMGIKNIFIGLMKSLAMAIGFLTNPITILLGVVGASLYFKNKAKKYANGETEVQIEQLNEVKAITNSTNEAIAEQSAWFKELVDTIRPKLPGDYIAKGSYNHRIDALKIDQEAFVKKWGTAFVEFTAENISNQALDQMAQSWDAMRRSSPHYLWALGLPDGITATMDQIIPSQWSDGSRLGLLTPEQQRSLKAEQDWVKNDPTGYLLYREMMLGDERAKTPWYRGIWMDLFGGDTEQANELFMRRKEELMKGLMVQNIIRMEAADSQDVQQAINRINELMAQYNYDITNQEYLEKLNALIQSVANLSGGTIDAQGWNTEDLKNNHIALPYTKQYRQAIFDVLTHYTATGDNTLMGSIIAQQELLNKTVEEFSEQWYYDLLQVISGKSISLQTINGMTGAAITGVAQIMHNNGKIDWGPMKQQLIASCNGFWGTLQDFASMSAQVYLMLSNLSGIDISKNRDEAFKFILDNSTNATGHRWDKASFEKYYDKHVSGNFDSPYIGMSKETFSKMMMNVDNSDQKVKFSNGLSFFKTTELGVSYNQARKEILDTIINDEVDDLIKSQEEWKKQINNDKGGDKTVAPPSQNDYASKYERSAAKPTHISFNIGTLANFDKTVVASSADERDMMASIEARMANTIYQIFAEAANQTQQKGELAGFNA